MAAKSHEIKAADRVRFVDDLHIALHRGKECQVLACPLGIIAEDEDTEPAMLAFKFANGLSVVIQVACAVIGGGSLQA